MNRFIKSNKPWLGLLGLAIIIVFLAFLFRPKSPEYQIEADQAVKLMNDQQIQVTIAEIGGRQLIDIRPAELFAEGHAENAINIPARNLLDDESIELFDKLQESSKEAVLYGTDELQTVSPCLLLRQLGYQNVKMLKGCFTPDNQFAETLQQGTEIMLLDTAAMRAKPIQAEVPKAEKKKAEAVIPVRQEVSSGGGC